LRWPERATVLAAARAWAAAAARTHDDIRRVAVFGSYARNDEGVGSDLDLLVEVESSDVPRVARLLDLTCAGLPVPADILVFTTAELAALRAAGRRLARDLDAAITLWP